DRDRRRRLHRRLSGRRGMGRYLIRELVRPRSEPRHGSDLQGRCQLAGEGAGRREPDARRHRRGWLLALLRPRVAPGGLLARAVAPSCSVRTNRPDKGERRAWLSTSSSTPRSPTRLGSLTTPPRSVPRWRVVTSRFTSRTTKPRLSKARRAS